jgi:hypothetical protein
MSGRAGTTCRDNGPSMVHALGSGSHRPHFNSVGPDHNTIKWVVPQADQLGRTHLAIYTNAPLRAIVGHKPHTHRAPRTAAHPALLALHVHAKRPPSSPPSTLAPPASATACCPSLCTPAPSRQTPLVPSLTFALRLLLDAHASVKDLEGLVAASRRSRLHSGPQWTALSASALLP